MWYLFHFSVHGDHLRVKVLPTLKPVRPFYGVVKAACRTVQTEQFQFIEAEQITFCSFNHTDCGPTVEISLVVEEDFSPSVYARGQKVPQPLKILLKEDPTSLNKIYLIQSYLRKLSNFIVCPGHSAERFQNVLPAKSGGRGFPRCSLYTDYYKTEEYETTVRAISCSLLVSKEKGRCDTCNNHEKMLSTIFLK